MNKAHISRVKKELLQAGVTRHGIMRAEGRYLPSVIHQNEHVMAAVYGRSNDGSAMLVATDRRVLYVDKKPMFTTCDEISYEVVAGVGQSQKNGLVAGITLFTRMGNYTINYATIKSAQIFKEYIESSRLESSPHHDEEADSNRPLYAPIGNTKEKDEKKIVKVEVDDAAKKFLRSHELGVLSTVDRDQKVSGSAIYYVIDAKTDLLYILTKSGTTKAHNITENHHIALTVYDEAKLETVQLQGTAEREPNQEVKDAVFSAINRMRQYADAKHHAPVSKLVEGSFVVYKITPTSVKFLNFKPSNYVV